MATSPDDNAAVGNFCRNTVWLIKKRGTSSGFLSAKSNFTVFNAPKREKGYIITAAKIRVRSHQASGSGF